MDRIQMAHIGRILRYLLDVRVYQELTLAVVQPLAAVHLRHRWQHPWRRCCLAVRMEPHKDRGVNFARAPLLQFGHRTRHGARRVRNGGAFAIAGAELPLVERALDAVAVNGAAHAQIGTHVRAVRIEDCRFAAVRAEHHKVLALNYTANG